MPVQVSLWEYGIEWHGNNVFGFGLWQRRHNLESGFISFGERHVFPEGMTDIEAFDRDFRAIRYGIMIVRVCHEQALLAYWY